MIKFEVGKTYETRSACDHDCIFSYTVVKRTAKRITIKKRNKGKEYIVGTYEYEGVEHARPEGKYSMCPVINANREVINNV